MGLRSRLFAARAGVGDTAAWRKGALGARHSTIPAIQTAIRAPGDSLPSWLFAVWAAGHGKDVAGVRAGRALCAIDLRGQSGGVYRSQFDERSKSRTGAFCPVV